MPVTTWLLWVLLAQLAVLAACAWYAVRLVTRPLAALAGAADAIGPERPHALRRILGNLIDNALKFGGGVRIEVRSRADALVIAVLDDGPGIAPQQLEVVLKRFYRIESSRNRSTGGTGLGLAIAHQLAIAMGAELTLLNRPEGGLEARVTLARSAGHEPCSS